MILFYNRARNFISFLLSFGLSFISFILFDFYIFAQNKVLKMSDAITYVQNHSQSFKDKSDSRIKKKMELSQAIDAVNETRKKESTVRFSLLFNIKLPEKHALPKEIDLLMKVPKIESEIKILTKELEQIKLSEQEKAQNYFITIYEYDQKSKLLQQSLDELNGKLQKLNQQLTLGRASQKDISSLKEQIKMKETQLTECLNNFEIYKQKLSDIIGFDVSNEYIFPNPLKIFEVDRSYLDKLIQYSLNNDFNVFKARNDELVARRKVDEIYGIYGKKWGNIVKSIENDVKSNDKVDLDVLLDKYQDLLTKIDQPWVGNYTINLLLFKINIPKEWFKKEYDGNRYFDDEKYAIIVAIKEREEAIKATQAAEKELRNNIKDEFENLKNLWKAYSASSISLELAQHEYDRLILANKLGQASYDEVDESKSNLSNNQMSNFESLISYNKQLSSFNKTTCGAIDSLMENKDLFLKSIQTGNSVSEVEELLNDSLSNNDILEDEQNAIIYYINNAIDQRKSIFGLQVMKGYPNNITHYELLSPERTLIAKKMEIDKTISILPIEYKGSTNFFVRLYDGDKFIDEATFNAVILKGKLNLNQNATKSEAQISQDQFNIQSTQLAPLESVIGMYEINNKGNIVRNLKINIPQSKEIAYYKIIDLSGNQIGSKNKFYKISQPFSYLGFVFNNLSKLKVNLFDANYNLKCTANFNESKNELYINNN